jgi:hypothetical protein
MDFLSLVGHTVHHQVMDALVVRPIKEFLRYLIHADPLLSLSAELMVVRRDFQMPAPVLGHVLFWNPAKVACSDLVDSLVENLTSVYGREVAWVKTSVADWKGGRFSRHLGNWIKHGNLIVLQDAEKCGDSIQRWLRTELQGFSFPSPVAKPFCLVAFTQSLSSLRISLRDRFPIHIEIDPLSDTARAVLLGHVHSLVKPDVDARVFDEGWIPEAVLQARGRSQRMIANHIRAFASSKGELSHSTVTEALRMIGVDEHGLAPSHRRVVQSLICNRNRPMVCSELASASEVGVSDLRKLLVPEMCRAGMLRRTLIGYALTSLGVEWYERLGSRHDLEVS